MSLIHAERWPLPGNDDLPAEEIAIAIRAFEATPTLCLIEGDVPAPTLGAWLTWCRFCWHEWGLTPSGV